ncbi:prepilin-type N-terminal cleavage/methylation domain-containing protein [Candidatus Saccharibacteria bacterium]|nr:prepilin-type N-terminal cleavage/methylation domain-containing protein [Candidatus Saccharibacteria bacterium]
MTSNKSQVPKKGFTLIELLIVITIIGVLAVAILSAINPIEQIRRAQDQGLESDASELLNGLERYYTGFFEYPWDALGGGTPDEALVSNNLAWIDELINKGEVKPQFRDRDSWSSLYVTQSGTVVRICFDPASSTFQEQADSDGKFRDGSSGCATNCFTCVPR